jgi:hypothetical protein
MPLPFDPEPAFYADFGTPVAIGAIGALTTIQAIYSAKPSDEELAGFTQYRSNQPLLRYATADYPDATIGMRVEVPALMQTFEVDAVTDTGLGETLLALNRISDVARTQPY